MSDGPRVEVPCVGAVVHDEQGRLLLVKRRNEPGAGLWSVPGGRVESGERRTDAVVREIREETGLSVRVQRLLGRVRRPGPDLVVYVIDDYLCTVVPPGGHTASGVPLRAGDDASRAAWFSRTEMAGTPLVDGLWQALEQWRTLPPPR